MASKGDMFDAAALPGAGPCGNCGWKEGDGVKVCFYDDDVGPLTHQNRHPVGLTAEQATLYAAYEHPLSARLVYPSEHHRMRAIDDYKQHANARFVEKTAAADKFGWEQPSAADEERAQAKWIEDALAEPLLTDLSASVQTEPYNDFLVHVYLPHVGCSGRGHPKGLGPYRIGCTGCDVEIRLWEHGIDYDVG